MTESFSDSILIARHPIFDNDLEVYGYELLFRGTLDNESGVTDKTADLATTRVINHAFMEFGIEQIVGRYTAFINLTRTFLTGTFPLPFSNKGVVLEILEDISVDQEIVDAVNGLVSKGYSVALDDFIFSEEWLPLIKLATIIKIDIMALSDEELVEHVNLLKKYNIKLLAEKVETKKDFEFCQSLGFDFYQGYFFCKPTILNDRPIPNNQLTLMRVLAGLQNSEITIDTLESLVSQDVTLSFKLLRFLNSAAVAMPRKIESLREGLVFLGLSTIKKWATLIALAAMNSVPSEILIVSLVRAKMAEKLATNFYCATDTAFMVGLFSLLDAMINKPMPELIAPLPLADDIKSALIDRKNELGNLLSFIIDYEQNSNFKLPENLTINDVNDAYISATTWVMSIENQIK